MTRFSLCVLVLSSLSCSQRHPESAQLSSQQAELRGVWLTNVDSRVMESRATIAEAMDFLAHHNFNVVFPVVWNKGVTQYPSRVMDSLFHVPIDSAFTGRDPLAEILEEAHARGIAVIPWFEFGFSSSMNRNGGHLLAAKPGWAARDVRGTLLSKNGFEWMSAYHPEVQKFISSLVLEVVQNYEIDGIQGDDRLPAQPIEGGYDSYTMTAYRQEHAGESPPRDFRDTSWQRWRADKLSTFAKELYDQVKQLKPDLVVSWSPSICPWSYDEYLQDWPAWFRGGYADLIHPQVYRYNYVAYKAALDSQSDDTLGVRDAHKMIYPGILMKVGKYLITEQDLLASVSYNRTRGYRGEVFFFYEGLRLNEGKLAGLLLKHFYSTPATLPFKAAGLEHRQQRTVR